MKRDLPGLDFKSQVGPAKAKPITEIKIVKNIVEILIVEILCLYWSKVKCKLIGFLVVMVLSLSLFVCAISVP